MHSSISVISKKVDEGEEGMMSAGDKSERLLGSVLMGEQWANGRRP